MANIPYLRELDEAMSGQDQTKTPPLLLCRVDFLLLDLVLAKVGDDVDKEPDEASTKVKGLVNGKGHDGGRKSVVLKVGVPGRPQLLPVVEGRVGELDLLPSLMHVPHGGVGTGIEQAC
jgi:hypothetical protein